MIACLTQVCAFYHSNNLLVRRNLQKLNADLNLDSKVIVNWQKRLTTIVAAVIFSTSLNNPALADGDDKGSKKSFEMCYSICMFDGKIIFV